jgi:hypothetical protein
LRFICRFSLDFLSFLIQLALSISVGCSPNAAGLGRVHEDVVLLESLDVLLKLVHLVSDRVHARLLANGVQRHGVVGSLLELLVAGLPLLFQGSDQLLALVFRHQELLAVTLVLLLDLHLTDQVVLVLDLVLDLGQVFGNGAVVLLLEVVLVLLGRKLGRSENVLDGVGNDEILVRNKTVDGLFIALGNGGLCLVTSFKFGD